MANAFFIFDPESVSSEGGAQQRDDKIIPDPVTMEVNYPIIDGKEVEVVATSGVDQYALVAPGDYPLTQDKRDQLSGGETRK